MTEPIATEPSRAIERKNPDVVLWLKWVSLTIFAIAVLWATFPLYRIAD